jgi:hypothetical protein
LLSAERPGANFADDPAGDVADRWPRVAAQPLFRGRIENGKAAE